MGMARGDYYGRVGAAIPSNGVMGDAHPRSAPVTSPIASPATTEQPRPAQLATDHLPLVAHLVREISGRVPASVDRDDLRSAGLVALVSASQAFDPSRGVPFSAYAATRIRGALLDELRSVDWASRSVRRRGREIEATRQRLAAARGAFPDAAAVAEALGLTAGDVVRADAEVVRASVLSIHGADRDLTDDVPTADPGPAEVAVRVERLAYLADAVAELAERLRAVVQGYFLDERPMAEIAAELGVTESRISQLRAEALVLLRGALATALEPDLVEERPRPAGVAARRKAAYAEAVQARYVARLRGPAEQSA